MRPTDSWPPEDCECLDPTGDGPGSDDIEDGTTVSGAPRPIRSTWRADSATLPNGFIGSSGTPLWKLEPGSTALPYAAVKRFDKFTDLAWAAAPEAREDVVTYGDAVIARALKGLAASERAALVAGKGKPSTALRGAQLAAWRAVIPLLAVVGAKRLAEYLGVSLKTVYRRAKQADADALFPPDTQDALDFARKGPRWTLDWSGWRSSPVPPGRRGDVMTVNLVKSRFVVYRYENALEPPAGSVRWAA